MGESLPAIQASLARPTAISGFRALIVHQRRQWVSKKDECVIEQEER
jgi:hypothetical protein